MMCWPPVARASPSSPQSCRTTTQVEPPPASAAHWTSPAIFREHRFRSQQGESMQLIINQQPCEFPSEDLDVPTLLASRGVSDEAVALAVNGELVPRRKWPLFQLADGDNVQLVKVVAGGAWDDDPL